ncbi:MAG: tyrosine-type recombinase/integrase [Candidatus Dormiibacterota bacterium]
MEEACRSKSAGHSFRRRVPSREGQNPGIVEPFVTDSRFQSWTATQKLVGLNQADICSLYRHGLAHRSALYLTGTRHHHSARHSAATVLLGRGAHPKIVSEMLGHSTVAITLDVYSHVTPAMHRGQRSRWTRFWGNETRPTDCSVRPSNAQTTSESMDGRQGPQR